VSIHKEIDSPQRRKETYYQRHTTALRSLRLCGEKWFHG
jgi:hypothetical protein